jgi:hypothetical protein
VLATTLEARQSNHRFPRFLPDGRRFLFYVQGAEDVRGIYLGSLDSPMIQRVAAADVAGDYLDGWLLFIREQTLLASGFDAESGKVSGDLVKVGAPVGADAGTSVGAFSVSPAGIMAYHSKGSTTRQLMWFDQKGTSLGSFGPQDENGLGSPEISPDESRVSVERTVQGNQDVWILEPNLQPFTSGSSVDANSIWSPDGNWSVFRSNRESASDLYIKPAKSAGEESALLKSPHLKVPNDWHEHSLIFYSIDPDNGLRSLWVLPVTPEGKTGGEPRPLTSNPNKNWNEFNGHFSPDGRFVAYQSDESKQMEILVIPSSGKARPRQVSTGGGIWPRWSPNGRKLYYLRQDGMLMAVSFAEKNDELAPAAAIELFRPRILSSAVSVRWQYDVDRLDRFLINTPVEAAASPLTLVLNWKPPA